jgi:geranylgeranyl pyrophosphate synthase
MTALSQDSAPVDSEPPLTLPELLSQCFLQGDDADAQLARSLPRAIWNDALLAPLREFLARPSKNFRGGLVALGYRLGGGVEAEMPLELPLIIECLHAGSLIVDDIEDGSSERRGAPALHCSYGLPRALNAGNWLYFWPLWLLGRLPLTAEVRLLAHERVALCLLRCHEGQALDLQVRVDQLQQREVAQVALTVSRLKTGGLLGLGAALGALTADAPAQHVNAIAALGCELGVGLQMLDDLSGVLNGARRHKALEDLRLSRVTWLWALLAQELDRPAYDAFVRELRAVRDGAASDALLERMRFRVGSLGLRLARERVRDAVDELATVIGRGSWCDAVLDQFKGLERRYVQG